MPVLTLEWLAARLSDLEMYQSQEDLSWARRLGVAPRSSSVLLGNGVDLSFFDPSAVDPERARQLRADLGIPDGSLVVGTVGRLVTEKGYRELFAAAATVRASFPHVYFLAVGDIDPEKDDTLSEAEMAHARKDVIFTGWREDVRDLLALVDIFVLASWREGVPRSAIEAAAMAKPLVLTDIRGCREVARDGVEGLLVPPRDPTALASTIRALVKDPKLRERLGLAAAARARMLFDEGRVADRVLESYHKLLARKGILETPTLSMTRAPIIRPARPSDAPVLAALHRHSLPNSFLPYLGDRFLRRLYRALASDPQAVTLVAENGPFVVGFACAVPSIRAFYRRFYRRHGVPAALVAAPKILRPGALRRARQTARYPATARALPDAELLAIAVTADQRGTGLGDILAEGVLKGLAHRGVEQVKVLVAADNERANRFYERVGFRPATQMELHEGRSSNVLVLTCLSSSHSGSRSS
jgi:ribosomal protein S18 acetylase RimI-like enzyme